jgi:hypothetical protein
MDIVKRWRSEFTQQGAFLGVVCGWMFGTPLVFVYTGGSFDMVALGTSAICAILGALLGRYATKGRIRSRIKNEMEELESDIQNHSEMAKEELLKYEAAVEEARLELEQLPALQAERLAGYWKKRVEVQKALASLK